MEYKKLMSDRLCMKWGKTGPAMKQTTTKEKITKNKPITDSRAAMLFKDLLRPVLNLLVGLRIPYKVMIEQPCRLLPDRPVIYAANHSCFADGPIMGRITKKRSYILCGRQRLGFSDWLYFMLNGAVFVDRRDREDRAACKLAMDAYLNRGRSVVMFPEGTWDLTENLLMLPMKWGIIETARNTGAQIIPTVLTYDRERKKCSVRFGEAMVFAPEDDRLEAVTALRDTLATMRWEDMGREAVLNRGGGTGRRPGGKRRSGHSANGRRLTGHTSVPACSGRILRRSSGRKEWRNGPAGC